MEKILTIQLLGNFHLLYDGETVPGIESPRLQSFLAYLLIHQDSPQSRQQLSYTFWPDSSESQARTNLRNMLYRLREVLPEADQFLDIGSQTLWWQQDAPFKTDLDDFKRAVDHTDYTGSGVDQAAHQQALKEAVEAYQGDLLPNCYDDWIIPERESLSQAYLRLLEELVEILELGQEYDAAIQAAQQLVRHDPLHENSYQLLMNLYALNGEKARAIRTYHQCVDALEKELGLDPSPAIMALYHQLMEREIEMKEPPRVSEKGSKLVGRDAAWDTLQETWNDFNQGTRLLLIMGEAGIGKTYLAEEFARWARREGINTLITHSYPTMGELAYTPVTTLLRNKLVKSKFPSLEETWLMELIRLMPELAVEYPGLPEPEHLTESWQRQRMFEASARALLGGESRLILVLDDLQWCDRETLDWLRFLVEHVSETKLMIIGTIRTEDLIAESPLINLFSNLERGNKITEILLDRLDPDATRVLAGDLWGGNLDEGDANRLFRETEGNPLFVAEVVRAGLITQIAEDPDTRILPPKIKAVIESRLNALSPPAQELATIAAVVGRNFGYDLLILAGDGNEEALVRGLDELWGRRLIHDEGEGYNFSHDKFREVITQNLSPHRRIYFHNKIAGALEELHNKNLEKVALQLASHYRQGGKVDQAVEYYLMAGDQARRLFARRDAIDSYQQAAALLENQNDPRSINIYQGWGDVLLKLASYPEAAEAYQKMLTAAKNIGDCEAEARAWLAVGKIRDRQGEHAKALDCAERALDLARGNDCDIEAAEAVLLKGQSYYRLGAVIEADQFIKESLDLCNQGKDNFTKSRCFSLQGLIQDDLGNYAAAREFKEQALEIIQNIEGDWVKEWIGTLYNNLANTANLAGNDQQALELYLQALEVFRATKNQDMIIMCQTNMGAARVGLGEYQQAEDDFRQVLALTENSGWLGLSLTCHFLAEACLGQGKLEEARGASLQALAYARETGARQALGAAWRSLGKVASRVKGELEVEGKFHSAQEYFQNSDRVFGELEADGERAHTLKAWAEHELAAGDKKKGEKMWEQAREIFGRLEMTAEVEKMKKDSS